MGVCLDVPEIQYKSKKLQGVIEQPPALPWTTLQPHISAQHLQNARDAITDGKLGGMQINLGRIHCAAISEGK